MNVIFKNDRITTSMRVHHMSAQDVINMFGNKPIELVNDDGYVVDIVYFHRVTK